jgi:hypothetical protein
MPINANHEFLSAEKSYLNSKSLEDKIYWLEEMIKAAPKHKGSENLLKELRIRLKKFKEKAEKAGKKSGGKQGIRKEGFQFVLLGKTNVGKSLLLSKLTNASPKVGEYQFTTKHPEIGTFYFKGISAQMIDVPSIGSENFDTGLVNNADCLLIVLENLEELKEIEEIAKRNRGKKLVVVNKIDRLGEHEKKKLIARMKSKKVEGVIVSAETKEGIDKLKQKLFDKTGMIRIYLKEPGKAKEEKPMVLKAGATVKDVGEHIFKGFSKTVRETRITGPSSKFPNQKVGLGHEVKDKDVVEFHTR